jgi:uncharacterized membrane protein
MAPLGRPRLPSFMEDILRQFASVVARGSEMICVFCIALGAIEASFLAVRFIFVRPESVHTARREVWVRFARWIILALEFALAADIARTAIAPTWDDIGQLAAIAVIRTGLNYFLERDLETVSRSRETRA